MRKSAVLAVLAVLVLAVGANAAFNVDQHDDVYLDYIKTGANNLSGTNIIFPGNGGPFWAVLYDDPRAVGPGVGEQHNDTWVGSKTDVIASFFTFCVEANQTFTPGQYYDIAEDPTSLHNSVTKNKALTGYAAWVFNRFVNNVLAGTINPRDNLPATKNLLGDYQKAIWMGMMPYTDVNTNGYYNPLTDTLVGSVGGGGTEFAGDPNAFVYANSGANDISLNAFLASDWWWKSVLDSLTLPYTDANKLRVSHDYFVMSNIYNNGTVAQDMGIIVGEPIRDPDVPEPASILIWSLLGVAGVSVWSRRRTSPRWSPASREAISSLIERGRKA